MTKGGFSVSILGAGPAGFALAADLEGHGARTLLYSHPEHMRHADNVRRQGRLVVSGALEGVVESPRITSDMTEAVAFSRMLVLSVPSIGQETILQQLRRYDLRRHTIVAVPGNLFALVKDAGVEVANVFETNLSPYSCRMEDDGSLFVFGKKRRILIAALHHNPPPRDVVVNDAGAAALLQARPDLIQAVFPGVELRWCSSVVEVCLSNVNGVFHPLMMLMNAGRVESTGGDFLLYHDGLTRSVANAMEAVDRVRVQVGAALGLRLRSAIEVSNECYGQHFADLVDLARRSPPHNKLRAPADINNRNISEDVPDLLVAWHGLAVKLGIDASPLAAVIVLVDMATGSRYMESGRTLRKLNLDRVSAAELVARFSAPALPRVPSSPEVRL